MGRKKSRPAGERLKVHPEAERLARGLRRCIPLAVHWTGFIYRATTQAYANRHDIATGEGSRRAGARYTPRGAFRAVYGGLDMETALAESLANHRRLGLPEVEALPLTFVGLRVTAERVLDLTRADVRRTLGVSNAQLLRPWRPDQTRGREALTQALGRLARELGFQGILYRSAERARGQNLVVFPDRLPGGGLEVVNVEQLSPRRRRKRS